MSTRSSSAERDPGSTERSPRVVVFPFRGTDAQLVALARSGAAEGSRLLYERLEGEVHRLVRRVLGPDPDHDDVVQCVFERVFEGLHRLREPEKLVGWARSVAVHVVRDELRRRKLRRLFDGGAPPEGDRFSYVDDPETRDLVGRAYEVFSRMPSSERVVFVLRFLEELTIPEIADACRCSTATVNRRLARAEVRFRRLAGRDAALSERLADARERRRT